MLASEDPDPGDEPRGTHRLLVSQSLHRVHASRAACRRPPAQSLKNRHVQGALERLDLNLVALMLWHGHILDPGL